MSQVHLAPYGADFTVNFTLLEVDGVDFRVDAVHASGDITVIEDEGTEATADNGFTDEGTGYSLVCSAAELTGQRATYYIVDQTGTKAWLDKEIVVETYGHPDAAHPDLGVALPDTGTAAAGASGTITLASSASTTADLYNGMTVYIVAGTGAGQSRVIHDYSAARVASISPNWATTPDTTSKYVVAPTPPANQSEPTEVNVTQISGTAVSTTTAQLGVNVVQVSEDATAAANLEAAYDGTGYDVGGVDVSELNQIVDDLINGGRLDLLIDAIKAVTDIIGTTQITGATSGTPSTTSTNTNLTGYVDSELVGRVIIFVGGTADGQAAEILTYTATGGVVTFAALTTAPAASDSFVIV